MVRDLSSGASVRVRIVAAASLACLLVAPAALSQGETVPDAPPQSAEAEQADAATPALEPAALEALDRMSAFLQSLDQFEIAADTSTEYVLADGQKVMLSGTATIRARRPDRFMIEVSSDRKVRRFYYDGATLTVVAPRMGFYAQVDAPPTIPETLDMAYQRHGIAMPLQDVFNWGDPHSETGDFESAIWVGPATVGEAVCDHYAYRTADADLQLWIARGEQPTVRKMVITSRRDEALPQYVATLAWRLDGELGDETFIFQPPDDAERITIASHEP